MKSRRILIIRPAEEVEVVSSLFLWFALFSNAFRIGR